MAFTLQVYPVPKVPSYGDDTTDPLLATPSAPPKRNRVVDRLRRRRDDSSYLSHTDILHRREYAATPSWCSTSNTLTIRVEGTSAILTHGATDIIIQADEVLNAVLTPHTDRAGGVLEITHVCLSTITTSVAPWRVILTSTHDASMRELTTLAQDVFRAAFPYGPRHFIALAAPTSGSGRGPARWEAMCNSLLRYTPHSWTTKLTTHRHHAEELAATMDLRPQDVVVAVGGDGMVHEVINGFFQRTTPLPSDGCAQVAHFPAGSGCAFAKSVNMVDQAVAVMGMIHCRWRNVDVVDVVVSDVDGKASEHRKIVLAALFSVMAAVDFESEWMRALGNGRFIVDVVRRVLGARVFYPATLSYRPATLAEVPRKFWLDQSVTDTEAAATRLDGIETIARHFSKLRFNGETHVMPRSRIDDGDARKAPPVDEKGWVHVPHHDFGLLYACNLPFVAQDWLAAPFARADDGCFDLIYSNVNFTRLQWTLGIPSFMGGECLGETGIRLVKCKEVVVELNEGYSSLDGERSPIGKLHFSCPGDTVRVMTGLRQS